MNTAEAQAVLVTGAGSWGTALALVLARNARLTYLWGHRPEHMAALQTEGSNRRYLPDYPFPSQLHPIAALSPSMEHCRDVILAVPCKALRATLTLLTQTVRPGQTLRLALACKGFEYATQLLPHEVVASVMPADWPVAIISGPTFAREVAAGLPTALTIASKDPALAQDLVGYLHGDTLRAYTSPDVIGVEVGGAVKNILAIAAGVADGLGFGANTRAALITRGLNEMLRLGLALGGQAETFMGLAGLGDLVLTCTDNQSRNRRLGLALAAGQSMTDACTAIGQEVEGIRTAREALLLANRLGVNMPITGQVVRLLNNECEPLMAVRELLAREPRQEFS